MRIMNLRVDSCNMDSIKRIPSTCLLQSSTPCLAGRGALRAGSPEPELDGATVGMEATFRTIHTRPPQSYDEEFCSPHRFPRRFPM